MLNHNYWAFKSHDRSKGFQFAFLMLEDHLDWFKDLLRETLNSARDFSNVNRTNCLGTVLALNGPRKSYSIYHAHVQRQQRSAAAASVDGDFLGFDASDNESDHDEDADKLFEADLLFGLGTWMERLCEGTVQKFRIEKWPEMT